jgi:hypothetical protein
MSADGPRIFTVQFYNWQNFKGIILEIKYFFQISNYFARIANNDNL